MPVVEITYGPHNQPTIFQYGNGVVTTNTYNPQEQYRMTKTETISPSGTNLQDIQYSYDAVGNIVSIYDQSQTNLAKNVVYAYDDLYRLMQATATNVASGQNYSQMYTYSPIGNIISFEASIILKLPCFAISSEVFVLPVPGSPKIAILFMLY